MIYQVSHDQGRTWRSTDERQVRAVIRATQGVEAIAEIMMEMVYHGLEAQMPSGAIYRALPQCAADLMGRRAA